MLVSPESCSVTTQEALHAHSPMEQRKPASVPITKTEARKRSDVNSLIVMMSRKGHKSSGKCIHAVWFIRATVK